MQDNEDTKEIILHLRDMYALRNVRDTPVTAYLTKWVYYGYE